MKRQAQERAMGKAELESCINRLRAAKDCWQPPETRRETPKGRLPLQISKGMWSCQHLDLGTAGFQNCKRIDFCYFKPPSLCHFVKATSAKVLRHGNSHLLIVWFVRLNRTCLKNLTRAGDVASWHRACLAYERRTIPDFVSCR